MNMFINLYFLASDAVLKVSWEQFSKAFFNWSAIFDFCKYLADFIRDVGFTGKFFLGIIDAASKIKA